MLGLWTSSNIDEGDRETKGVCRQHIGAGAPVMRYN